jgi:hypothetical protein
MAIAFCMKEKKPRRMMDEKEITLPNGRIAIKGVCPKCGSTLIKVTG